MHVTHYNFPGTILPQTIFSVPASILLCPQLTMPHTIQNIYLLQGGKEIFQCVKIFSTLWAFLGKIYGRLHQLSRTTRLYALNDLECKTMQKAM